MMAVTIIMTMAQAPISHGTSTSIRTIRVLMRIDKNGPVVRTKTGYTVSESGHYPLL